MSFRGFISADLPRVPSLEVLLAELRDASRDLKVVSARQLHLTLKFLGDTEEGLVPEIVSAMREASAGIAPFALAIRGTGAFPNAARPRVLWVGLDGAEPLGRIANSLNEDLKALGFAAEARAWSPHVTLARVRGTRGLAQVQAVLRAHEHESFAETRVEEIRLKKSVLRPEGPEYTTIESVRLQA